MKSELRTELKSNLLADRLEETVLAVKPYLKLIGFSVAAIAVASVVYGVMHSRSEKASANAWSDLYFAANRQEKLDEVSQDFPTTSAGLWAKQKSADALMSRALEQVYVDRDLADKLFVEAVDAYRSVLAKAQEPMLVCRATYGLAQALDSQGNATEAGREYKKVLTLPGSHSDMVADAQRRLQFIESEEGRTFYEWFKTNRPTAPKPVDIPANLGNLPTNPDLQFATPPIAPPSSSENTASPPESKPTDSGGTFQMPPAGQAPSSDVPAEKSTIVEPPAAKPDAGSTSKPATEPATAEPATAAPPEESPKAEPKKPKAKDPNKAKSKKKKEPEAPKDNDLKIPDPEPAVSEKKAGGS